MNEEVRNHFDLISVMTIFVIYDGLPSIIYVIGSIFLIKIKRFVFTGSFEIKAVTFHKL